MGFSFSEPQIYIAIVTALLGISYPILLQVISRLDDKYSSISALKLFKTEKVYKGLKYTLFFALIFTAIWSLKIEPFVNLNGFEFWINNSANILVYLSTIILIIAFYYFVEKVLIYYSPIKFAVYLNENIESKKSHKIYFEVLGDVLIHSIRTQNSELTEQINQYFTKHFQMKRTLAKEKPVEFPEFYYTLVHKVIDELSKINSNYNKSIKDQTVGGLWLIGGKENKSISEKTMRWLWLNLKLVISYERDDFVLCHWEGFHNYYSLHLLELEKKENRILSEEEKLEMTQKEDNTSPVIKFHIALGGLLMFSKRYNCIKQILNYTTDLPERYKLLPKTMIDIFINLDAFLTWTSLVKKSINYTYSFPDLYGIKKDDDTIRWIALYLAILYLRQFTLPEDLIVFNHLCKPKIPESQAGKRALSEVISKLELLLKDLLKDKKILKILDLDKVIDDCVAGENKENPLEYLVTLKKNLEEQKLEDDKIL